MQFVNGTNAITWTFRRSTSLSLLNPAFLVLAQDYPLRRSCERKSKPLRTDNTPTLRRLDSRRERIRPFYGKARFPDLRGVCRGDAGELGSNVVDDVKVAVGPIVVPQANICAGCLRVRRIHLNDTAES